MPKDCLALYHQLESKRMILFDKLDLLEAEMLSIKPAVQKWSILQVCYHLIRSEELSLLYLKKKIRYATNIRQARLYSSIRSSLLYLSLQLPFKLPAPKRVAEFPADLNWHNLMEQWENIRLGIRDIIENLPEGYEKMLIYRHPLAGRLTLFQMLTFFKTHISRHENQIERLIIELSK